jgi:hypothetical protein
MARLFGLITLLGAAVAVTLLAIGFTLVRSLSIGAVVALGVIALLVILLLLNGDR